MGAEKEMTVAKEGEPKFTNIVVCGGDLVGKSTLLEALTDFYGRAETHHGTPIKIKHPTMEKSLRTDLRRNLMDYWNLNRQMDKITLWDRIWCVSDLVYNPTASFWDYQQTVKMFHASPTLLVIMVGSDTLLRERFKVRGDEFLGIEEIVEANERYRDLARNFKREGIPLVYLDVDTLSTEEMCIKITQTAMMERDEVISEIQGVYI